MKDISQLIVRVIDSEGGSFLPIAQRIARDVKLVEYFVPAWELMPTVRRNSIGDGFDNIRKIDFPFSSKNPCDLMVFPDIDYASMQEYAVSQGIKVWGNRGAEELENNRGKFLKMLGEVGLPKPSFAQITGISALQKWLEKNEDFYIKVSRYRGDWETLHWRSWEQDKTEFYRRAIQLGPIGEQMTFYVFDPIDAVVEDGVDTWCIDGKYPSMVLRGVEKKDVGYLGTVQPFADLPDELKAVNEAMAPVLKSYGSRGFFSTEVRITEDGASYFIDPTIRAGIPPSQIQSELFENYVEILAAGAEGEVIEPIPTAKFGAQVLLKSKGDPNVWREYEVPDDLEQWVKLAGAVKVDDRMCVGPNGNDEIGWLCATGDTIAETVATLLERIDELPEGMCADQYAIADLIKEISSAEDNGIEFTDQKVPEPEVVVQ